MCADEDCSTTWGLAVYAMSVFFTGYFMAYDGSYWRALWVWLFGDVDASQH